MIDILSQQIKGTIENSVFNQLNNLGLGISNPTVRAIASRAAEEMSYSVVNNVNYGTNYNINTIPQNLIGLNNPVNLVNSNIGSTGLTNNLGYLLNTQFNSQLTDKLVSIIQRELSLNLPADKLGIINFANLAATLTQSFTPTIGGSITTALAGIADAIFGRNLFTPLSIPGVSSLFNSFFGGRSGLNLNQVLGQVDNQYAYQTANKYISRANAFDVNYQQNQEKLVTIEKGFIDPQANYPTKEYSGISETNKLAQGDVRGTVVQAKNKSRMTGAKLPGGEAWDQPEAPYKGEYPYNKVTQTESGHIFEIDDTPGAERLHLYHKSGTFVEIDVNGSVVMRTKGSKYEIIDRNGKISIRGSADISVVGSCNIFVGNDANIEVEGDTNLTCHNDITAQAGGTFNLSAVEEFNITSNNVNIEAYKAMNVKSNVSLTMSTTKDLIFRSNTDAYFQATTLYQNTTSSYHQTIGSMYEKVGSSKYTQTSSSLYEKVGSSKYTQTSESLYEKVGSSKYTQTTGSAHTKTGANYNVDTGGLINLNSGAASSSQNSQDSQDSKAAKVAGPSKIGIISGRKKIKDNSMKDPVAITIADSYALKLEESNQTPEELAAHRDLIITSGFATPEEFDKKPITLDTSSETSTQSTSIMPADELRNFTTLPGNYNLSPNFTLEMLSSKAACTKNFIEESDGIKYGDIVHNLSAVALNILEPAYNLYPKLLVTSGYRHRRNSSQSSQHPLGQCVDIQFQGATKEQYFDYAKQLVKVLNYDQLILEYCGYTNNPWIHISFKGSNNRKQVMTFWNHQLHSSGLSKLA